MKQLKSCSQVIKSLESKGHAYISGVSNISAKTFYVSRFLETYKKGGIWICEDPDLVPRLHNDFKIWSDIPSVSLSDESKKGEVLAILAGETPGIVFGSVDDYKSCKVPSYEIYTGAFLTLKSGVRLSQVELFEHLINIGYTAEGDGDLIKKGTFRKRGGTVDIYLVNEIDPVRMEFFEDQIDNIFSFNLRTGKKNEDLDEIVLFPSYVKGHKTGLDSYLSQCLVILDEVEDDFNPPAKHKLDFTPFLNRESDCINLGYTSLLRYHKPIDFCVDLKEKLDNGWDVKIFAQDKEKVWNFLIEKEFTAGELEHTSILGNGHLETWLSQEDSYRTAPTDLDYPEAFIQNDEKILVITAKEIFGSNGKAAVGEKVGSALLETLQEGNHVVHIDHGVGKFSGISRNEFGGIEREYLVLEYAKNDKLYVPVDKAERINKYVGMESPKLTLLGSAEWDTVTRKAKEESDRIAKELLEIYAQREAVIGHAFDPDTPDQKDFAACFGFDLTPGQTRALSEIKDDMEKTKPMDRLLCGDVGFGKTEIAMRAAFKAIKSGKQVAFLAPITILVDQHYKSFAERMEKFGIRIDQLSRFRTPAEQEKTVAKVQTGELDIVVGTHRLIQEDIKFKNLGLVIIDEEQRFGVKQKEDLRSMRANVDVLTLTATPIPRTLNMGLAGLRDISTISTPPPGRLPVHTEIRRFTYPLIRDVIMREMERGGQAYFLHNRVATIEGVAEKLRSMLPEAKIVVAHGQLTPHELEKRILAFKRHEYDVLVSSTIIENGIDLSNANTLIVDRAEAFGLSQAHQLRGRVGRSQKQAYAYFLYQAQQLKPDAKKRLKAIMDASDLGSGFQIAMKDLDIRGAGDVLGAKQHGAINTIGISHFTRMLNEAVMELKASSEEKEFKDEMREINIDLKISSFIPDEYVPETSLKLNWYQRISGANSEEELSKLKDEITDRYGELPEKAVNLFKAITLRIIAKRAMVGSIEDFVLEGSNVVDVVLSKQIKPESIMAVLSYNGDWTVTGNKLRITKDNLIKACGTKSGPWEWIDELTECVGRLIIKKKE